MIEIKNFINDFDSEVFNTENKFPWEITDQLEILLIEKIKTLSDDYIINGGIAIHKSAEIEQGAVLKGTLIINENCRVGAYAYLRGPIFLGKSVNIGPGSEIKQSIILDYSATAHFNYIGNSIIGKNVNFEAGSICANHFNEREEKNISVIYNNQIISTGINKFGSLVGDDCKIGANAVLSPGSILNKKTIVKRLELIEQVLQ
ncbi:LpxA family transferase [Chryseobacterium oncorhynchi]|uniref:LpxA family transferase n=1 Tax=Chryseobacterium oncorhynchi TaxID=741074 RepID=A0A316WPG0_9FLAO|nr:LpxA family transferase [Chryseobacterium oncorhynchi]PWN63175.1 LpxA family transferase [Chryseobacterium oncorhynchi]